ncbi:MAG: RAMP superfamily CRISPR-associated protein [Promethearchaeota archaeon]
MNSSKKVNKNAGRNIFNKYILLTKLSGKITTISDIRIGREKTISILDADLPILVDSKDYPIIPGSSLKGFFRGNLLRLLKSKNNNNSIEDFIEELFGGYNSEHASALMFHQLKANKAVKYVRKHIRIKPESQSVANLFEVEYVPDNVTFEGIILTARNVSPLYLALIKAIIDLANSEIIKLGGFKSRGYGSCKFDIDEMDILLCGISKQQLLKGIEIQLEFPSKNKFQIKSINNETSIKFNFELGQNTETIEVRNVEIKDNISILGISLIFKDKEEINKFLNNIADIFNNNFQLLIK